MMVGQDICDVIEKIKVENRKLILSKQPMSEEVQKEDENSNLAKIEKRLVEIDPKIFEGIPKQ